jgi:hypothetical protein
VLQKFWRGEKKREGGEGTSEWLQKILNEKLPGLHLRLTLLEAALLEVDVLKGAPQRLFPVFILMVENQSISGQPNTTS